MSNKEDKEDTDVQKLDGVVFKGDKVGHADKRSRRGVPLTCSASFKPFERPLIAGLVVANQQAVAGKLIWSYLSATYLGWIQRADHLNANIFCIDRVSPVISDVVVEYGQASSGVGESGWAIFCGGVIMTWTEACPVAS